jgi:CelD/BcsL family acetyltransferase involved in cellulose biosynthesis
MTRREGRFSSESWAGFADGAVGWGELANEWDELVDRVGASPFLRPGWFDLWQRSFGDSTTRVLVLRRSGRLVGVLPLQARRRVLQSMTNDHTPAFEPLAEDDEACTELAVAAFALRPNRITLDYLEAEGPGLRALRRVGFDNRYLIAVRDWERPPYVSVAGSWEEYERGIDGKLRRDLARRTRRLGDLGAVSVEVADGTGDLQTLLEEGFALETSGWKDARGTAIVSRPETRSFYTGLADWGRGRTILRLSFLRLDGRALAFQFGLEDRGTYYFVKGGYDDAYTQFAPAKLLVRALLKRAFDEGLNRFEFLGPPERFKLEWTSTCHDLKKFQAFARTPPSLAAWATTVYGRPVARRLRNAARDAQQLRSRISALSRPPHS